MKRERKIFLFTLVAGGLLLTACQSEQTTEIPEESKVVSTETTAAETFIQEEAGNEESSAFRKTAEDVTDSSAETTTPSATETANSYTVSDLAGTWQINGEKTQAANEHSLIEEFGTGIHLGNEMILAENGDFSYYVSINQGGKGTWKLDGTVITADYTTYEPDAREEQLTMTPGADEKGEPLIKMTYTDGYILFWSRPETENAADGEPLPVAKVPAIPQSEVAFEGYPAQTDYDFIKALSLEPVKEEEGTFGGSPVIWSTLNDRKFLYFYYTYDSPEKLIPQYSGYAIIGEDVKLACGLHVGMTAQEAEAIVPGLYHFKWENPEYSSSLDWNPNAYPQDWCRQFPQILIAEVEGDSELPMTIGLLLDEQEVIRAICFNYPTAG